MHYTCRKLSSPDLQQLKDLRLVYAEAFEDHPKFTENPPSDTYLQEQLQDSRILHLVAETEDGVVAGGLTAYILPKIEAEVAEVYLYDLAVLEAYRTNGMATSLIHLLQQLAKEAGAKVIFVQADTVDTPAMALYQRFCEHPETEIAHFDIPV
jgi:ribosomal protein S18 acetylase RimI-like enzyme